MSNIRERFFIYSREQMDRIMDANKNTGRPAPVFGKVIVNGVPKIYTDILTSMDNAPFADAELLISGDLYKIKHTKPSYL
jgi:hypothetical protein|nr:MAG TPA: hypothetical protein [Caudoviricetes sp.]